MLKILLQPASVTGERFTLPEHYTHGIIHAQIFHECGDRFGGIGEANECSPITAVDDFEWNDGDLFVYAKYDGPDLDWENLRAAANFIEGPHGVTGDKLGPGRGSLEINLTKNARFDSTWVKKM